MKALMLRTAIYLFDVCSLVLYTRENFQFLALTGGAPYPLANFL